MVRFDVLELPHTDAFVDVSILDGGGMVVPMFVELPKTDASVDVSILDGGGMIGNSTIMHANEEPKDVPMSCWVFYIHHPKTGKKVIWDVGISAVDATPSLRLISGSQ